MKALIYTPRGRVDAYSRNETHEHRAPTDESVRLLKEMEEKAAAKITASVALDPNHLSGQVLISERLYDHRIEARCVLSINGKRIVVEATSSLDADSGELATKLADAVARRLAADVLTPALAPLGKHLP